VRFLVLVLLPLAGCASLPPTIVPTCDGHFEVTCHAPVELWRSMEWESVNACPWPPDPNASHPRGTPRGVPPGLCACYEHRGVLDSRAVYEYRLRRCLP